MKANDRRFLAVAAIALLAPILAGCSREAPVQPPPVVRPVKTLTVGSGGTRGPDTFPGRVAAARQVDLSFRVGGPLIELPAREGEFVAEGQLLARIDPRDYRLALDAARAQDDNAQADFDRFAALYEKDSVSKAQLDQARARRDVARASLEDAEAALDDTTLRAPFDARVGARFVENFQDVRPKEPILSLVDVSSVKIEVDMPENRIARARRKDGKLTARFHSAPGREFDLTVLEIAAQADPRTQTYLVTLIMPQPQGVNVLPGMTAIVAYDRDEVDDETVIVPAVAVFAGPGGDPSVWIVDPADSTVHLRAIDTGELTGDSEIRVVEGLESGDSIAITAVTQLQEGMEVRPVDEVRGL